MGHHRRKNPRHGSLQIWPRKRASSPTPRIRTWSPKKQSALLGFCGYKAGMTHVIAVDNRPRASTKGEEIRIPVTILEVPAVKVAGVRLYAKDAYGAQPFSDILSDELDPALSKKLVLPKKKLAAQKIQDAEAKLDRAADVRVLVSTKPRDAVGKKKPELMEIAIGGTDVKAKFEYAKSMLGKEVLISDVFKEGELVDAHAVTKGKGLQGPVKRFGIKLKQHKTEKGRRRPGTLGPWHPSKVSWWVAQSGQCGYHTRTEYNKQLLKFGTNGAEVTPDGGFVRYGEVKNNYALIAGSVAGPKKRLIRLTHAIRLPKKAHAEAPQIVYVHKGSQQ